MYIVYQLDLLSQIEETTMYWRQRIVDVVYGLNLLKEHFVLCGSSSIAMFSQADLSSYRDSGSLHDIDIVVSPAYFKLLSERKEWHLETADTIDNPFGTRLVHDELNIEIFHSWQVTKSALHGLKYLQRNALKTEGILVSPLSETVCYKQTLGREKDIRDLKKIRSMKLACP